MSCREGAGPDRPCLAPVGVASARTATGPALYARGYHCGIIPADSGMVTKLAPFLGFPLTAGPAAHEELRQILEASTAAVAGRYRELAARLGYRVTIPDKAPPTWLVHLVLIYFKRLYLNKPSAALCQARPACDAFLDCHCPPN